MLPLLRSLSHIQHRHNTERGHRDQNQENPVNRQQHQTLTQTQIGDVRNHPARDVLGITREERTHHLESELRVLLEEEEAAVDENGQVVSDGGGRDDVEHRQQPAKEGGNAWGEGDKNGGILDIRQESGLVGRGDEEEVEETEDAETDEEIEGERVWIHAEKDQGPYSEQGE